MDNEDITVTLCRYFESRAGCTMSPEIYNVILGTRSALDALAANQNPAPDEADLTHSVALACGLRLAGYLAKAAE